MIKFAAQTCKAATPLNYQFDSKAKSEVVEGSLADFKNILKDPSVATALGEIFGTSSCGQGGRMLFAWNLSWIKRRDSVRLMLSVTGRHFRLSDELAVLNAGRPLLYLNFSYLEL